MQAKLEHGQSIIRFDGKPSVAVRDTLKRYGYRWSPSGGYWWCRCNADKHLSAASAVELAETGSNGTCEKCKASPGKIRKLGWNEPEMVLCDNCCKTSNWHPAEDPVDRLYEDNCRDMCGLGPFDR